MFGTSGIRRLPRSLLTNLISYAPRMRRCFSRPMSVSIPEMGVAPMSIVMISGAEDMIALPASRATSARSSAPHNDNIAVSDDGSRVYFAAAARLLPGAPTEGIYRVDVADHELAYVAPGGTVDLGGATAGIRSAQGKAISPDGSVFVFRSNDPTLNAVGGQQNGGTEQYYRYDDRDRSLVCASCPGDGSVPAARCQ